ncbi:disulfide reductase [Candidatus Bathyarchaeota archaeon]|nr:disulfide reductase [Candidatus Bathyarchaeota archaeon]NIU80701.1 disulfide reductase [Candidatus Bathyarchaeota archaeon]NIV67318.1 disulfide reductase [Candidatus Bathyarchaeota archaeon]NIW16778.1 disulfide reductase [Candidatus Bathyarchaeota archaeon]NIW33992.1 disulfide reductase [Candidatus Bathyarchaeota archaeon]
MAEEELRYLLFLGCVIPYRVASYELSTRKVLGRLGVDLVEMPDFTCCGLPLDPVNHEMMLTLAARNLCLAEQQSLDMMTLCNGCFGVLNHVNKELKENKKHRKQVNEYLNKIGMKFKGNTSVKHLIHVLVKDVGLERIKDTVQKPLNPMKVAVHTGCHVLRPSKYVEYDDPENPTLLKKLVKATGAESMDYLNENECCGNPIIGINSEVPLQLARHKLKNIRSVGAEALITICPFCHMMYDLHQPRIERVYDEEIGIPILHYPQLLGLAMGMNPEELAFKDLRVDASELVTRFS